jgi:hypothetical protein
MLLQARLSCDLDIIMRFPKWLVSLLALSCTAVLPSKAQEKPAAEVIIKMEPYVVAGERVLPPPESWRYVSVPALELTRGKKVIVAPGYEVLSNLSVKNTEVFIHELQLRQTASTVLWPMIVQALPREPMVVIIDRTKQAASSTVTNGTLAWEGDPIAAAAASEQTTSFDTDTFNTGMQMIPQASTLAEDLATDPTEQAPPLTTRMKQDGALEKPEESPFKGRWKKPLPAGFTYVRANHGVVAAQIQADTALAGTDVPEEEELAADLSRRAAEYTLATFPQPPPRWYISGMGWLIATTRVTPTRITYSDTGGMLKNIKMPPLTALLSKTTALTYEEDLLSAAFTHWGLNGDGNKHATKFMTLVQRQSQGEVTPGQFEEIFGLSIKKMELELSAFARNFTAYKSTEYNGDWSPMSKVTAREATQSEIARLQADSLISQGKLDLALNILRIAYWRGEREPAMLAILAGLEEKQGSLERARKITQALIALPTPPARVFIVEARLRLRDVLTNKPPEVKLTAKETKLVMEPLSRALQAGQTTEEICLFFAEVVLRSAGKPHESVTAFLNRAAKRFPKNETIRRATDFAQPKPAAS